MLVSGRVTTSKIGNITATTQLLTFFWSLILRNRIRNLSSSFLQLIPSNFPTDSLPRQAELQQRWGGVYWWMNSCLEKTGISRGKSRWFIHVIRPCWGKYRPNLGFEVRICYCGCLRFFVAWLNRRTVEPLILAHSQPSMDVFHQAWTRWCFSRWFMFNPSRRKKMELILFD